MSTSQRPEQPSNPEFEQKRWRLHRRVALRPEPFGALAYHYDNRRLNFLRSDDLVALVTSLNDYPNPRAAFDAQKLSPGRWPAFRRALASLAASNFVEPVEGSLRDEEESPRDEKEPEPI